MSALVKYDQARLALAACRNVDDIKDIRDKSEAMRLYAKQANDTELEQWAAEIKLRAQRAIGEISAGLEKQKNQAALPSGGKSKNETLKDAGISTSTAHRYEQLATIPLADVEALIAKHKDAGKPVSAKAVLATFAKPAAAVAPARAATVQASDAAAEVEALDNPDAPHFDADETVRQPGPVPAPDLHLDAIEEDMTADELLAVEQAEVARLSDEVTQLRARIALLEQGSDAAQLLALERDRDGYRNTSTDHFNKWAAANKKAIDYKALLDRLCKIAGVSKYSELAARITPAARS